MPNGGAQNLVLARGIQPSFRRPLLAAFRDDAGGVWFDRPRNADHFGRGRHFEVQRLGDALFEPGDIGVDDVAAIFAQMRGNAIGAGGDRRFGSLQRIGMAAAPRIPDGSDVIDVDAEPNGKDSHVRRRVRSRQREQAAFGGQPFTRSAFATTFFARNCEMIEVRCLRL